MKDNEDEQGEDEELIRLIRGIEAKDNELMSHLIPQLYEQLRALARKKLQFERKNHTLNTTALVHEAYITLSKQDKQSWNSHGQFLAATAHIMRYVLISYAEKRNAQKRGGDYTTVPLDAIPDVIDDERAELLLNLDEALERLAAFDQRGAKIVELKFFGGLTQVEIAEYLGITERTVRRNWVLAKTWIQKELGKEDILQ